MERPALICKGELLLNLRYIRNTTTSRREPEPVNYCLVYRTSETQPDSRDQSDLVNYCLVCGTSETDLGELRRACEVSYYLIYGTSETCCDLARRP